MTGTRQPRFSVSTGKDLETPKIVEFKPAEPKLKPTPVAAKPDTKRMSVHEMVQLRLDPESFPAPATQEILSSAIEVQHHIPVVLDILIDAVRRSQAGDEVHLTPKQWQLLNAVFEILAITTSDLAEGASQMEWTMALSSILLGHLWDNPTAEEAAKVKKTHELMMSRLVASIEKENEHD